MDPPSTSRIRITPLSRPVDIHRRDPYARPRVVMLVDDEREILSVVERALAILLPDVVVVTHTDPTQALDELRSRDVDVIVSDHQMPAMDGATFLALARTLQPRAARLLLTGTQLPGVPLRAINEAHVSAYLTKPVSVSDVARAIDEASAAV